MFSLFMYVKNLYIHFRNLEMQIDTVFKYKFFFHGLKVTLIIKNVVEYSFFTTGNSLKVRKQSLNITVSL